MIGKFDFALDTSFAIALLRGDVRTNVPLRSLAIPFAVAGELLFGAMSDKTSKKQSESIHQLVDRATILPADGETARLYSEVRHRLKRAGTPIPENDIWIAAGCLQHAVTLLTLDRHFERIEGLKVAAENEDRRT